MPLDPRIAMGFQSPQFESPINLMGKLSEMTANANQSKLAQAKLASQLQADAELKGVNALAATPNFDINNPAMLQQLNASEPGRKFVADYYTGATNRANFQKADTEVINSEIAGRLAALESIGPTNPNLGKLLTSWRQGTQSNQHLQAWMNSQGIKQPTDEEYLPMVSTPEGALQQYNGSLRALRALAKKGKPNVTQVSTIGGEEFIDDNPESLTFGQTLFSRGSKPPSPGVNIRLGPDESEFAKTIAGDAAKNLGEMQKGARSANSSYSNIERLTPLLNSEAFISGTLGNTRLSIAKALGLEGAEETQTFFSQMGRETAETIKSFGAGTGLSDNDRIYAEKIAGGNVDLTPGAIKRILFLRQQANRAAIIQYNDERRVAAASNPKSNLDQYYRDIPVPPPPSVNYKGWKLYYDKKNNAYAYVSPDGKSFQETR